MKTDTFAFLINMRTRSAFFLYFILFLVIFSLSLSYYLKVYDTYIAYGVSDGQNLLMDIPLKNSDAVKNNTFIKIAGKKDYLKIINISELKENSLVNYQTYNIALKQSFCKNEVVKITFYYNKERIIKKIMKIIF